jgi:hypothetical protein
VLARAGAGPEKPIEPSWVAFPRFEAGRRLRRRVAAWVARGDLPAKDLAMPTLAAPVPAGVTPAPLRLPEPDDQAAVVGIRVPAR